MSFRNYQKLTVFNSIQRFAGHPAAIHVPLRHHHWLYHVATSLAQAYRHCIWRLIKITVYSLEEFYNFDTRVKARNSIEQWSPRS